MPEPSPRLLLPAEPPPMELTASCPAVSVVLPEYVFAFPRMSVPAPVLFSPLPAMPLMTPESVAKSRLVVALSCTCTVRTAPLRLIGFTTITSESAYEELRMSAPVPLPMFVLPLPHVTPAPAPPKFTTKGEAAAEKPPLWFAIQLTCPAPGPMVRVNVPTDSKTTSLPAVPLNTKLLFGERLLMAPKVSAVPAAMVCEALRRTWVASRIEVIVPVPPPVTAWPRTSPLVLFTQKSVVEVPVARVETPPRALDAMPEGMPAPSCARRTPCVIVVAPP